VSLAKTLFNQDVPEIEVFEGPTQLDAWKKMNAVFLERNWGDGFPLVPPTPEDVARMLKGTHRDPQSVVSILEPCFGIATVEKIAINAVMAGCKPEDLPILIAAAQAIVDPRYSLRHVLMSTSPYTPMLVVNGPVAKRIGMNSGMACLGPGAPSAVNTAIGRALRLMLMNIAGNYVGVTDMDTIGDPNKYSMCLAEREEDNPWEPLQVERGYAKDDSTVTAFVANTGICHADHWSTEPVEFLRRLAQSICQVGVTTTSYWMMKKQGEKKTPRELLRDDYAHHCLIILCPNHARMLNLAGWSKIGIKEVLQQFCKVRVGDAPGMVGGAVKRYKPGEHAKVRPEWGWLHDYPDMMIDAYRDPDCFDIIVAGADSQKSMVVLGGVTPITVKLEA
jgi:hypothetical protein